jgi:uncharacterized delta-60 repeat protein
MAAGLRKPVGAVIGRIAKLAPGIIALAVGIGAILPTPVWAGAGDLDVSFGAGGRVITDIGSLERIHSLLLQANGKIVAVGEHGLFPTSDFALARYTPNGTLDATFGAGGIVTTAFGGGGELEGDVGAALQPDGKILAVGSEPSSSDGPSDFALVRYNPDGSLDPTFGSGGMASTAFGGWDEAHAIAIQPDGKVVAGGQGGAGPVQTDFALARYNPDGSLDPTFGIGGRVLTDFSGLFDRVNAVSLQPDGNIVAAGGTADTGGSGFDFALARYLPDGTPDPTFGTGGKVSLSFGNLDEASALGIQADGRIVIGGFANPPSGLDFALARYDPNGILDPTFGNGGTVLTHFAAQDHVESLAILPGGSIVAVGTADFDFALARYNADGSLDPTFGTGGKVLDSGFGGGAANAVAIQADGKILAGGVANLSTGGSSIVNFAVARYLDMDSDDDGISDHDEQAICGTDPFDPDSDDDGIPDDKDVQCVKAAIQALPESAVKGTGLRSAMDAILDAAEQKIAAGDEERAVRLLMDLRRHVDGCADESGAPDHDDWIVDCSAQLHVRDLIDVLIARLGG